MIKLLILSAGTNASYHVAKTLREKFPLDFYIVGVDINPRHLISTANLLDAFYQVPHSTDPAYYNTILTICNNEKIEVLLPSFDIDQQLFYPENKDLKNLQIKSLGTPKASLNIYADKLNMNTFLAAHNLPVPKQFITADPQQEYFIKPKNGVGSIGARKISGSEWEKLEGRENFMLQEICHEPEITLECFYYQGRLSSVARERIAAKAGVCVKTHIYNDEKLKLVAEKFVHCCATPLYFNLQFMKGQMGTPVITDVNLRLAGGMSLSAAAGWDEVSALAKVLLKRDDVFDTLPDLIASQYVVRAYTDIVTKIERPVIAFDWDGTLLDSRKRHILVMNQVLEEFNISLDTSDLVSFKRSGKNNIAYLQSKGLSLELVEKIQKKWISHIEDEKYLKQDILYTDVEDLLKKYSHFDLILITARKDEIALRKQVAALGLTSYFKQIFVVSPGEQAAQEKAKILTKQHAVALIGDTQSDAQAAQMAGISFEYRTEGFHDLKKLIK